MADLDKVLEDARKRLANGEEPANVAGILRDYCPEDLDNLAYLLNHETYGYTSKGDVYGLIEYIEEAVRLDKEDGDE